MFTTIIQKLKEKNLKISTMESCTGGTLASEVTNIEGASEVFEFGAITYSNEYKIKMGVDANVIDRYTVYSMETAHEMSKTISNYTHSDYGIGITGKLNRKDTKNLFGQDNLVYISIYDRKQNLFYDETIEVIDSNRIENKKIVIKKIEELFTSILDQYFK